MSRFAKVVGIVALAWGGLAASDALAQCGCGGSSAIVVAQAPEAAVAPTATTEAAASGDKQAPKPQPFFGNAKCPIMGGKTDPKVFVEYSDPKTHTYAKVYVCCAGCIASVKKDPATAYKKAYLDRELKDKDGKVTAKKGEPLDLKNPTCPIMGGKVAADQYVVYNGYKIGLCCPDCEKAVLKSPEKYLAKLVKPQTGPAAPESQKDSAPADQPSGNQRPPTAHQH